jgi:hypothetical protein
MILEIAFVIMAIIAAGAVAAALIYNELWQEAKGRSDRNEPF